MKRKHKAISLFSGGLDSVLVVLYMQKLGYEVIPIFFNTPFFALNKAIESAKVANIKLEIFEIAERHLEMVKNPKYGYGKFMNPCIDCHALMFRAAGEAMEKYGADFVVSGEVLSQRPMSQNRNSLNAVAKTSGIKDLIVRPLSQKLLTDTLPIREGWVIKEEMLDIQGRSRRRQIALAEELGLKDYQSPAGGCLLTDKIFSHSLKELLAHEQMNLYQIKFIPFGRNLRISDKTKFIIGRTKDENELLSKQITFETVLKVAIVPGPLGVVVTDNDHVTPEEIETCASILLYYVKKAGPKAVINYGNDKELDNEIEVESLSEDELKKYRIN